MSSILFFPWISSSGCRCVLAGVSQSYPEPYIYAMVVIMLGIGAVSSLEHSRQKNSRY